MRNRILLAVAAMVCYANAAGSVGYIMVCFRHDCFAHHLGFLVPLLPCCLGAYHFSLVMHQARCTIRQLRADDNTIRWPSSRFLFSLVALAAMYLTSLCGITLIALNVVHSLDMRSAGTGTLVTQSFLAYLIGIHATIWHLCGNVMLRRVCWLRFPA
jgi:hypothetical protein